MACCPSLNNSDSSDSIEVLADELEDEQDLAPIISATFARVRRKRSKTLYEVVTPEDKVLLMTIPKRFPVENPVEIGKFVIVEQKDANNKFSVRLGKVMNAEDIMMCQLRNVWPTEFEVVLDVERNTYVAIKERVLRGDFEDPEDDDGNQGESSQAEAVHYNSDAEGADV